MNKRIYEIEYLLNDIISKGDWRVPKKDETIEYIENGEIKNYDDILIRILFEEENEMVCFPKSESVYLIAFVTNKKIHDIYAAGVASRVYRNIKTESGFRQY